MRVEEKITEILQFYSERVIIDKENTYEQKFIHTQNLGTEAKNSIR